VLGCVIAEALFERFPAISEGDLTRMRANLVNRDTLARVARATSLSTEILLGESALKSGGARPSILADALEAVFGAVFIDGGYDAARAAILRIYAAEWDQLDPAALSKDAKTRLQEWLQARRTPVPEYAVTALAGEAHAQTFTIECRIPALGIIATGSGPSRRVAEQAAAEQAYAAAINQYGPGRGG
jgi:ribonuclease-3